MPKKKSKKKLKQIKQILDNGKTQILTIENGQVVKKKTLRRRSKSMNIFDPNMKVNTL